MNASLFQLFSLGEILARLGQTLQTGCIHIFTQREAANIYFKDGIVVAAAKGLIEGEEVVKQVIDWKDTHMVWQPDESVPSSIKTFGLNIGEFLQAPKSEPAQKKNPILDQVVNDSPKPRSESVPIPAAKPVVFITSPPTPSSPTFAPVTAKALNGTATLLKLEKPEASAPPAKPPSLVMQAQPEPQPQATSAAPPKPLEIVQPIAHPIIQLTATKAMPSTAQVHSAQEEALLRKHRMTLVSKEDPKLRFRIARASSLIGRNPACDINIISASVSRQHCLLQLTDRGLHLKDLGTTNGTKVNGIALTEGYVNAGDKLTIGHELFVLEKDPA